MQRFRLAMLLWFVAAGVLFLASKTTGVESDDREGQVVYCLSAWAVILPAIAGTVGLASACLTATARIGLVRLFALLFAGLTLMLFCASYDAARSHVTITNTELILPMRGFPHRQHYRVKFADIAAVMVDREREELTITTGGGATTIIPFGDLVRAAYKDITAALASHNVPLFDGAIN